MLHQFFLKMLAKKELKPATNLLHHQDKLAIMFQLQPSSAPEKQRCFIINRERLQKSTFHRCPPF
jgi:hypothetical protein